MAIQRSGQSQYFLLLVLELVLLGEPGLFYFLCAFFQSIQASLEKKKSLIHFAWKSWKCQGMGTTI
jgi:hypothetical protein